MGIDLDPDAHAIAQQRLSVAAAGRREGSPSPLEVSLYRGNYSEVEAALMGLPGGSLHGRVDGILMDLGVSSMQLDTAERGFSFSRDGPIDMRMDPGAKLSAEEILNTYSEVGQVARDCCCCLFQSCALRRQAQLGRLIREYGEEKSWRTVSRRIVEAREQRVIKTTQQLAQVCEN